MDFSWSTPLRRNGHTSLALIPNEIYLAIFDCIASSSEPLPEQHITTFTALALVCRFFCAVALPRVFQCVVFFGDTTTNTIQASRKTTWVRRIVKNAEPAKSVALYVKECHFKYWHGPKEVQRFLSPFSTLYCHAMARMTNIRKVEFHLSFVNKEHWEAMAALKQLDCLHFKHCSFTENPPDQELSVRDVTLVDSPTPFTLWPIATSTLRTLETSDLEAVLKLVTVRQLAIKNFVLRYTDFEMNMLLQVFEQLPDLESVTFGFSAKLPPSPLISGISLKKLRMLETSDLEAVLKLVTARQLAFKIFVLRHTYFKMNMLLQVFEQLPDLESVTIGFRAKLAASPLIRGLSLKKLFTRLRSFTVYATENIPQHVTVKLLSAICDGPGTLQSLEILDLSLSDVLTPTLTPTLDIISNHLEGTIIPAFPNLKCVRTPDGDMRLEQGGWKRSHISSLRRMGRATRVETASW